MNLQESVKAFEGDLMDVLLPKIDELSKEKRELEENIDKFKKETRQAIIKSGSKEPDVLYAFVGLHNAKYEIRLAEVISELDNLLQAKFELSRGINKSDDLDIQKARENPIEDLHREMKKRGRVFVGKCPFHEEKQPSFTVYPQTNSYYCFSCHKGGDSINFIMQLEGLSFVDAVKRLA